MFVRRARATVPIVSRLFSTETATETEKSIQRRRSATSGGRRDTLGGRLLGLVYPRRSAVIAIQKWKEEGRCVRKYELNRVVRELRKFKRYKHALEICEWMVLQQDIELQPGDYAVHLDLIAKVRGLNSAEKFFEDLPEQMRGHAACTALLHTYVQNKLSDKAEALMQKMSECGFVKCSLPYTHMISLYISKGQLEKVPGIIEELKRNTSPDIVTYNLWLRMLASQNDTEAAEKVFLELKKAKVDPDWITYSTLTNMYIKAGERQKAEFTLKEMEKRASRKNRITYGSLLSLHANMGNTVEVCCIWKKMKSLFHKMKDDEYISMISSLVKLEEFEKAENMYDEWESVSGTGDARIPNIIIGSYTNRGFLDLAEKFYQRMVQKGITPSYTTWEILALAYTKRKQTEKVLDCFKKAVKSVKKWNTNVKLIEAVCTVLEDEGDTERAEEFLFILRKAGHVSTEVYNSLLRTYAKAGKMPLIVEERMKKDNVEPDEETYNLIKLTSKMCVSEVSSILS